MLKATRVSPFFCGAICVRPLKLGQYLCGESHALIQQNSASHNSGSHHDCLGLGQFFIGCNQFVVLNAWVAVL